MLIYKNLEVEVKWVGNTPCLVEILPNPINPFIFPKHADKNNCIDVEGEAVVLPMKPDPLSDEEFNLFVQWLRQELELLLEDEEKFDNFYYYPHRLNAFLAPLLQAYLMDKGFAAFTRKEAKHFKEEFLKPLLEDLNFDQGFFNKNSWAVDFQIPYMEFGANKAGIVYSVFESPEQRRTPMR